MFNVFAFCIFAQLIDLQTYRLNYIYYRYDKTYLMNDEVVAFVIAAELVLPTQPKSLSYSQTSL